MLALALPCLAGREKFGKDKYSMEFPDDWKKPAADTGAALIVRQNKDGSALFAVSRLAVKEGMKADLDATMKSVTDNYQKDLGLKQAPKAEEGAVDGLDARFAVIMPPKAGDGSKDPPKDPPKQPSTTVYLVVVDAKTEVLIFQATLAMPLAKKDADACMAIIQSFKRE
jgi:hypothetical protein